MALVKIPAKDWTLEIQTNAVGPVFTAIGNLETFGLSESQQEVDTTDMDSGAGDEHMIIRRGKELSLEGFYMEDTSTGDRDPGQAAVETLSRAVGNSSLGVFRVTSPGGTTETFSGSARAGGIGGDKNGVTDWNYTIKRSGDSTIA